MTELLTAHFQRYPQMQPQDTVKLLFQAIFGGEHMITDPVGCLAYLQQETEEALVGSFGMEEPLPIGNGLCRISLGRAARDGITPEQLCRLFLRQRSQGTVEDFHAVLSQADALVKDGKAPFSFADWSAFLSDYFRGGIRAVHHSEIFRKAYRPAYRLADVRALRLIPTVAEINRRLPSRGGRLVVAIDGCCASGKTTAAELLSTMLEAPIVHMDDFFLPPELRTPTRLAEVGGNIDYDRFAKEVLPHVKERAPFSYRRFDCSRMTLAEEAVSIPSSHVLLVEGSYSHHPRFGHYADLTVFLRIDPTEQMARILLRNGAEMARRFREEWIPMEEAYFSAFDLPGKADLSPAEK